MLSLLTTLAMAAPTSLTVNVVDTDGAPVTNALVQFADEGDLHPVNIETGDWQSSLLYKKDGGEIHFGRGIIVKFNVIAAGYQQHFVHYVFSKKRNQTVNITLEAMSLEPVGSSELEQATLDAVKAWVEADAEHIANWTDETAQRRTRLRENAGEAALKWLQVEGEVGVAMQVCEMAARSPDQCTDAAPQ